MVGTPFAASPDNVITDNFCQSVAVGAKIALEFDGKILPFLKRYMGISLDSSQGPAGICKLFLAHENYKKNGLIFAKTLEAVRFLLSDRWCCSPGGLSS
jgi:hypothetical protein